MMEHVEITIKSDELGHLFKTTMHQILVWMLQQKVDAPAPILWYTVNFLMVRANAQKSKYEHVEAQVVEFIQKSKKLPDGSLVVGPMPDKKPWLGHNQIPSYLFVVMCNILNDTPSERYTVFNLSSAQPDDDAKINRLISNHKILYNITPRG